MDSEDGRPWPRPVRSFRFWVVLQIAVILALGALLVRLLTTTELVVSAAIVGVVLVLAVAGLLRYVESTNRKLAQFLLAVQHSDYSQTFSSAGQGRSFDDLAATMDGVLERLRATRGEREEQAIFLRTLVQHVPVALVAIEEDGQVTLFNNAARRLFGVSQPHKIQHCRLLGEELGAAVLAIAAGQQVIVRASRAGELLQLNLSATLLRQRGRSEKLVCIQDISSELEARELEAVQKLMRVLSHEVMNSITPITSLAETAADDLAALGQELGANDRLDDIRMAVETIGRRGGGLTRFVNSYREMTRLPEPEIETCSVLQLLGRTAHLMHEDAAASGAEIVVDVDPKSLEINADPELLEQALINLVRNALDAVRGRQEPAVRLQARVERSGQVVLAVSDNGCGLTAEARRNLFVPFFTTKKAGNGIGMSVVRQIVRLHRGSVGVESEENVGTTVSLRF
jgi:nitrogen fixation/metabolism regulation signal transduction histidine kinase